MKRKLLQVNVTANWGSTGRIAEQINHIARERDWDTYLAYGRYMNPCQSKLIKVGSLLNTYEHYAEHRLFDNEGLASKLATKQFIRAIHRIQPDIIHLHNIHDHWLNYRLLFEYLNTLRIPIVWTQHDCWSFTGGCCYYNLLNCNNWKKVCENCKRKGLLMDKSKKQFLLKKKLFTSNPHLTFVPVSYWLERELMQSFLQYSNIHTILNGVDIETFHPTNDDLIRNKYNLKSKFILLAVATTWSSRKNLTDYINLSKYLPNDAILLLVGLSHKQMRGLPSNIIPIPRTSSVQELVSLYSLADIVLNLSLEETFGLTTVEGYACGTPSIVYNATASPELIVPETGKVVEIGNIKGVLEAIDEIKTRGKDFYSNACRKRAENLYDKNKCFENYLELYDKLLIQY